MIWMPKICVKKVLGKLDPGQSGPGPGPNCPGPDCPGPNLPRTFMVNLMKMINFLFHIHLRGHKVETW